MPPWRCRPRARIPGQIATLILPSDTSWNEGGVIAEALPVPPKPRADPLQVRKLPTSCDAACRTLIVLGGGRCARGAGELAHRIAAATERG